MPLLHIIILALIQGITEFLPISSSGHLVLAHEIMGGTGTTAAAQQDLLLDIAVHVGTLFSVLLYFRKDVAALFVGAFKILKRDVQAPEAQLGLYILLSSIPVIVAGFAMSHYDLFSARNVEVIAWTTLLFGILLWAVDRYKPQPRTLLDLNWKNALFIGLAQMLALIPGTSRSGITMTAARWLGFTRAEAARYSLLLAIVAISGAGTLGGLEVLEMGNAQFSLDVALAAGLAFVSGWVAIALMMQWLARATFAPFALYRVVLGLVLLWVVYGGGNLDDILQ